VASISTRLTERFGSVHAFVEAGMAFAGQTADLAIQVSRAGGIGTIGVGFMPPPELRALIVHLREELGGLPFNVNFITVFGNDEAVQVVAEEKVPIASFHWGHPPQHQLDLLREAGVSIWEQVGTTRAAVQAVDNGIDVVIAQGWEAGGHNYGGMGLVALVPEVVDAVGDRALVLASGGISDARGVAAALALGADGVWVGTRLVATLEAHVHAEHHRRILEATGEDTIRSAVFGPEMPAFNPMRLLKVRVVEEYNTRVHELPTEGREHLPVIGETMFLGQAHTKHKFDVILPTPDTSGDYEEMAWLAGQGVGLIHEIKPAAEVVIDMMEGAADVVAKLTDRSRPPIAGTP